MSSLALLLPVFLCANCAPFAEHAIQDVLQFAARPLKKSFDITNVQSRGFPPASWIQFFYLLSKYLLQIKVIHSQELMPYAFPGCLAVNEPNDICFVLCSYALNEAAAPTFYPYSSKVSESMVVVWVKKRMILQVQTLPVLTVMICIEVY